MSQAKPFLKWVGGKTKLVPEILKRFPEKYGTYHEPFLGGGAVFFTLQPEKAVLSDLNDELVDVYAAVKWDLDDLTLLLDSLTKHQSREAYLDIRSREPEGRPARAARTIYLNKCGFNGLYRVNKSGKFNVPWSKRTNVNLYDHENLVACSAALQNAQLHISNFTWTLDSAERGDLIYLDPPYAPVSGTSDFTAYTKDGFTWEDQVKVHDFAEALRSRGCHVVLSNAGIPSIRELYSGWQIDEVSVRRNINSDGTKRGGVPEFIIS